MSGINDVLSELGKIKDDAKKEWDENIISSTVSSLLLIEKQAMYGSLRGKANKMNEVIIKALKNI